jgi:hypothetical protein
MTNFATEAGAACALSGALHGAPASRLQRDVGFGAVSVYACRVGWQRRRPARAVGDESGRWAWRRKLRHLARCTGDWKADRCT